MTTYAHSKDHEPPERWHRLDEHLRATAEQAQQFAEPWGAGDWAWNAGWLHDLGKFSADFQRKLTDDANAHIRVDHSTAGAQRANKQWEHAGKLLAYTIAGHHTGLPDGKSNSDACLERRLQRSVPALPTEAEAVTANAAATLALPFPLDNKTAAFRLSFFTRMLFSCLVDADFLDTEKFMDPSRVRDRAGYPSLEAVAARLFPALEKLNQTDLTKPVNIQRAKVLAQCLTAAEWEPGLFSLTVPTGGGKTLSSLAFALHHALRYGKCRVIYVIPFTSIIEQNADVFRRFAGPDAVLEHHSNFEPREEDRRSRLAAENWDAPVVVTTNVQFFESLFGCRSSVCRKLHNIANSVVILDEAQTLPVKFLRPCLAALRELAATYRTSIVLCTATQPALSRREDFRDGLEGVREIVRDPVTLAHDLRRVDMKSLGKLPDADLVARLAGHEQVLCVVSTRRHARKLFEMLPDHAGTLHLSALMCPAHRTLVLRRIRRALKYGKRCRVISTQLIEAGVDIDFPVVYRALAGLDSIAQAAGRCNREGRLNEIGKRGEVFVFEPESAVPTGFLRQTAQTAQGVMRRFPADFMTLNALEEYFRDLYWLQGDRLDAENILRRLAPDIESVAKCNFAFREVSDLFQIIRDGMQPVIIPWNKKARTLIAKLPFVESPGVILRKLQRYVVSVHQFHMQRLIESHSVELVGGQYAVLKNLDLYRCDTGLDPGDPTRHDPESLIG
jgi:CRISPR-associated endonuclease/helicase Cas3